MTFLERMNKDFKRLVEKGAEKIKIGKTVQNSPIYAFAVGCGEPKIIVQYAIHAREYITYFLAIRQIEDTLKNIEPGRGTVYFVPVVNIDGVSLVLDGIDSVDDKYKDKVKSLVKNGDFSLYKANIRGVDLNVNFDARYGTGAQNVRVPSAQNYIGEYPESEPEVRALVNFTRKIKPNLTISYHSKGEVIYYDFYQSKKEKRQHKKIAKVASLATGYKIVKTGKSAGGYKDWCIQSQKIPALTIEVGSESLNHPITEQNLEPIYQKNAKVIINLLDYLRVILYNN